MTNISPTKTKHSQTSVDRRNLLTAAVITTTALPFIGAPKSAKADTKSDLKVMQWMSWQGGVDLVGLTNANLKQPNVIVHLARMVHTPVGSAPSGMVLYQPDPSKPPEIMGFVSSNPKVGAYFGPNIFKGTPFETAPVLKAKITIDDKNSATMVSSKIIIGKHIIEITLSDLGPLEQINRPMGALPFTQQGLEAATVQAKLKINGLDVPVIVPPMGMSGGAAAVWSPSGLYAR